MYSKGAAASEMVKWKTGLSSCRTLTTVLGKQVDFGLEISKNDTNYLISFNIYCSELRHCADINLCHSDLFPSQTELKVIGHTVHMPDPKSSGICKRYFKA